MPERIIAEAFPPGEFIKEELETRGWAQADLAEILGIKGLPASSQLRLNRQALNPTVLNGCR